MHKILLIEDNENVRENTAEILELAGYEVMTAENGKRGVEIGINNDFDLIICDIMMPELDGYGVLHILNKNPKTSHIPFIFLTAKAEKSDFRKGMNLGADDYLTKPFDDKELLETIELRLKKSTKLNKAANDKTASGVAEFISNASESLDLDDLISEKNTRHYRKKENVYREGEYPRALFFIISGKVKLSRISEYGKEFITSICSSGEFIGHQALFENTKFQEDASIIEDSEIASISVEDFKKLIHSNREVANNFIKILAKNISDQEERLLKLAYGNVRERVAFVLNHIHEKYGKDNKNLGITISREELAGYTGIATESLIRTMSEFKAEGVLENDGRSIRILDAQKLSRLASGRQA